MPIHFTVYRTTNLVNGRFYVGYHETEDPHDGYLGSGLALRRAVKKYGRASFKKEVLFDFATREEMVAKERELVTTEFKRDPKTYNLVEGGPSAFTTMPKEQLRELARTAQGAFMEAMADPARLARFRQKLSALNSGDKNPFFGSQHSAETRTRLSDAAKQRTGERNSQHGTVWVHREGEAPKKVSQEDLPGLQAEGWARGRVPAKLAPEKAPLLPADRLQELQDLYTSGVYPQWRLAEMFGVSQSYVSKITQHLPRPKGRQGPPRAVGSPSAT